MSEHSNPAVSIDDLEAMRSLALTVGQDYLGREVPLDGGRFTVYDNLPAETQPSKSSGHSEHYYSFIGKDSDGESSMSLYFRDIELSQPTVIPARLEAFRFKWSDSRVSIARMFVSLRSSAEYIRIPGDNIPIYVPAKKPTFEEQGVTGQDMNSLWTRLCDMAAVGYNKQAA